jgi:pimeloyl-ACP methyl ester carboxylesterase
MNRVLHEEWEKQIMKSLRKLLLSLLVILVTTAGAGFIYQWMGNRQDIRSYKPVGRLVEVEGRKMHLFSGGTGKVTIVFASGWGTANPYVDFYPLYDAVSKSARFAVYDRFGYGYSEETDKKRDIDQIVSEVHELLQKSDVPPPYVFVGHSLGSLEVIRFAQNYPDEVKGIVLIDGGSPEYYAAHQPITAIALFQRLLVNSGAARLLYHFDGFAESLSSERNELKLLSPELKEIDRKAALLRFGNRNMVDEMRQSQVNARQVASGPKPLKAPLTVLSADYFGLAAQDWKEDQSVLTGWSVSGKQIVVKQSGHYIHQYNPGLVADEILKLVRR